MLNDSGYGYANAMLGNFYTYVEATNRVDYAPITLVEEGYVTDHWKVTNRLNFDIGVRVTNSLAQKPANNNAGNFVPATYNPAQAPALYRPAVVNGAKVVINPLTGAVVLQPVCRPDRARIEHQSHQRHCHPHHGGVPLVDGLQQRHHLRTAFRPVLESHRRR